MTECERSRVKIGILEHHDRNMIWLCNSSSYYLKGRKIYSATSLYIPASGDLCHGPLVVTLVTRKLRICKKSSYKATVFCGIDPSKKSAENKLVSMDLGARGLDFELDHHLRFKIIEEITL